MNFLKAISRRHFVTIDSTHTYATKNVDAIQDETLLLITASEQTNGRGRYGNRWVSTADENLLSTFAFLAPTEIDPNGNIPQVLALSVSTVLTSFGITPQLKWPNDILVNKMKIGGILATTSKNDDSKKSAFIASIGLNVGMEKSTLLQIGQPATSIYVESGEKKSVSMVADLLAETFFNDINLFLTNGFAPFLDRFRDLMIAQKDERVRFHVHGKTLEGFFQEITNIGSLKIAIDGNEIAEFTCGELLMP